jgi:tRNA-Thr(GGU) m(6)t(6)A37 methyltransferase TsaA
MNDVQYQLQPIGSIQAGLGEFTIAIEEAYRPAMAELEGFSHINVLWWCHLLDDPLYRQMVIAEKPYKKGPEAVGIFATRSPARPNPIALTAASLISTDVATGKIQVAYIDAEDGSPVLDIKPYVPAVDRIRETRSPQWAAGWPDWYEDSATFDWGAVFETAR